MSKREKKLQSNQGVENEKNYEDVIIPQRYIPFDIGCKINSVCRDKIDKYLASKSYVSLDIPELLRSFSSDVIYKIQIRSNLRLYLYSYGIGVFMFEDDLCPMGDKYAVDYCDYRKSAHKELLEFKREGISELIDTIIDDLRRIVKEKNGNIRPSADHNWEYNGLSYIMTISYILKKNKTRNDYEKFTELDKKNLQIMLQPSLAHKEDSMTIGELNNQENFDPYNFDVTKMVEPYNWIKSEDCAIYISWAAVVVYLTKVLDKYMDIIECLEVDLQAMWLYVYCQYINLKEWSSKKKLKSTQLKREKYNFQRKYNEFISENDSSVPVYISEIRNELVKTSGIDKEKENFIEYIDFCTDETESYEGEQQRKYSVMNEVLLFIIAFLQIAPMLYNAMTGSLGEIEIWPILLMSIFVIISIVFIIKKD